MASDVVPNGIKIEWNYVQNGIPVVNRVYVTKTSAPGSGDLDDAAIAATAFYNDLKALQHPTLTLTNITVTDVHVANGLQLVVPFTTDNVGTAAGTAAAANAAQVISLRTAQIGRAYRGRFYAGGLSNGNLQDSQNWGTAQATTLAGYFEDFIDALNGINMTLVVVSRFLNGVQRAVAVATEVIALIVDTKVDSQRRRTAN